MAQAREARVENAAKRHGNERDYARRNARAAGAIPAICTILSHRAIMSHLSTGYCRHFISTAEAYCRLPALEISFTRKRASALLFSFQRP
ncbi:MULTISPECIES: hypothetical protein [Burkholderia]|uniref:Uncharacterized protein n=1 Tax=Burkholderia singularis TaxID=1503053 RepID=A0A238H2Q0_9BURK|nr:MULTISPECIES: hypothetical protein [Burkholderia]AOK30085.1 hypothetical protein AQ611_12245 [Burkholderia sp. Bp7605]SMF99522.1 hypothetical protein BSIN_2540 [Burkholderia singularis]